MQNRRRVRERNTSSSGHRVHLDFGFRILQWPGLMMNVTAINIPRERCVEAITLREPMLQRGGRAEAYAAGRLEFSAKRGEGHAGSGGLVVNCSSNGFRLHLGVKVGKMKEAARCPDCGPIGRVQTEEIDTRPFPDRHVGAYVQFRKGR